MADDGKPPGPAIPAWQKQSEQQPIATDTEPKVVHEGGGIPKYDERRDGFSREEVARFLEDPSVRDAPEGRKRSFLEGKGVRRELIDELLQAQTEPQSFDVDQFKSQSMAPVRDTPPIVTYPEFLVKPQKPPPLVTVSGLLTTAYVAGSLAAAFYGVSKYIIEPMTTNLTDARHSFATHAHDRVKNLNEKLGSQVSRAPEPKVIGDAESITSDPTELFYHDVGVQTSPPASRRSSSTDSSFALDTTPTHKQEEQLKRIKSHLDGVLDTHASDSDGDLSTSVQDLREYLNSLVYSPPASLEYGMWSAPGPADKQKKDAIGSLRDEIRGVKGVLLSARRFPVPNVATRAS